MVKSESQRVFEHFESLKKCLNMGLSVNSYLLHLVQFSSLLFGNQSYRVHGTPCCKCEEELEAEALQKVLYGQVESKQVRRWKFLELAYSPRFLFRARLR